MRLLILSCLVVSFLGCYSNPEFSTRTLSSPSGENASLPRLYTDNSGTVFMSWIETKNDTSTLFYSKLDGNKNWSPPEKIASSNSWFVNWADFPSVIARNGKPLAAHWLKKTPGGTYAYNVEIASALNDWETSVTPHNDNTATEHGFVSMVPVSDSTFLSIWLDGRNTAGHGGHDAHDSGTDLSTAMTLRSATLDMSLNILEEHEIDASVCDCCGTAAVQTSNGFITAYRNRSEQEIRDIYVARFVNGTWSTPTPVHNDNWNIAACPVNGPAIAASGNLVAVAWYTAAHDSAKIKLAISDDEGTSFNSTYEINNGNPLGRVDIEILNNGSFLISWMERNTEDRSKADFIAKQINESGNVINEYKIADMSSSRRSGFPQLTGLGNKIIAAWTHLEENKPSEVRLAVLE